MALVRKGLIAIAGTTGVGKSQLAIEVARALNGEVINADAMQVYRGYDIITNKVGPDEMQGVQHRLLGTVDSAREYTVHDFERDALAAIGDIHGRDKVAVLVGGTNYYMQSVMFNKSLISEAGRDAGSGVPVRAGAFGKQWQDRTSEELWNELREKDPVMAEKWHPNDRRKVLRALEVLHTTGRRHSEWIRESEQARAAEDTLRFPTLVLWLHADPAALNPRLDVRVDAMVERGLLDEVRQLAAEFGDPATLDFTVGLRQAIGFRELAPCLRGDAIDTQLQQAGIVAMKAATRRYAKRQVLWLRNKLLPACRATLGKPGQLRADVYVLDATDLGAWDTAVRDTAITIARQFVSGHAMPAPESLSAAAAAVLATAKDTPGSALDVRRHRCDVCSQCAATAAADGAAHDVWLFGDDEYQQHLRSRRHRKNTGHLRRVASGDLWPRKQAKTTDE
ncbi:tRNA dimethylallyltransferase, mitochondrial [Coemansia spiralis]|nr:tRNA dimethylallyltransferase, mitochondrial [Coemansia spiralis]